MLERYLVLVCYFMWFRCRNWNTSCSYTCICSCLWLKTHCGIIPMGLILLLWLSVSTSPKWHAQFQSAVVLVWIVASTIKLKFYVLFLSGCFLRLDPASPHSVRLVTIFSSRPLGKSPFITPFTSLLLRNFRLELPLRISHFARNYGFQLWYSTLYSFAADTWFHINLITISATPFLSMPRGSRPNSFSCRTIFFHANNFHAFFLI